MLRGLTTVDGACGDVSGDNGIRENDGVLTDANPRADDRSGADPGACADGDGKRLTRTVARLVIALQTIERMLDGDDSDVGSEANFFTDGHSAAIQDLATVVEEDVVTEDEPTREIALESFSHVDVSAQIFLANELCEDDGAVFVGFGAVEGATKTAGDLVLGGDFRVTWVVPVSSVHTFEFGHLILCQVG